MTDQQTSTDIDAADFVTDDTVRHDPYEYLAAVRDAVYNDNLRFSSCTAVTGPFPGFPVPSRATTSPN